MGPLDFRDLVAPFEADCMRREREQEFLQETCPLEHIMKQEAMRVSLTDADCEGDKTKSSDGVLDQVWTASAQQGCAGLVVLTVVSRIETVRDQC